MASPLLSRWFVRCRRNESSPLFIFFSTWNYEYASYQLNQMLTRAREDPWWKLCIASCVRKATRSPESREVAGELSEHFQHLNLQILCSTAWKRFHILPVISSMPLAVHNRLILKWRVVSRSLQDGGISRVKMSTTAYSAYSYVNYISEVFSSTRKGASAFKFVTHICVLASEEGLRAVKLLLLSSSHRRHIKEMKRAELMWQCSTNENTNEF